MQQRVNTDTQDSPSCSVREENGGATLALSGQWTALSLSGMAERLAATAKSLPLTLKLDLTAVSRLDTGGALLINRALSDKQLVYAYGSENHKRLMEFAAGVDIAGVAPPEKISGLLRMVDQIGRTVVEESKTAVELVAFLGEYIVTSFRLLANPGQFPVTSLIYHMEQVGVAAVPIVALLSFLIGMVIAYMGAQQLSMFGLEIFVIKLIEITALRELGVLMTSIVIAGRSGSSFTAQIGAMVANEEVAAMRTMGLSPMLRLVFPRITGLLFMLPALAFLADVMSILGGGVAVWLSMGMGPSAYAVHLREVINISNFWVGIIKAPFFAVVIGVVGCYQGFQVTGSAESVGKLTTKSVVESIFMVIVLDALFAIFFTGIRV